MGDPDDWSSTLGARSETGEVSETMVRASFGEGSQLGRFTLESVLGEGGFSVVYKARDERGRPVAVKILRWQLAASDSALARFERELEALRRLDHPNIVRVLDAGLVDDGRPFIVTEWIDGRDLGLELAERGALSTGEAIALTRELGDALACAHARGLVHRDINPRNVLALPRGKGWITLKLIDFGIVKEIEPRQPRGTSLTSTGALVGTPGTMSPEQITGASVDQRTDIYALGLLLFHMLTGRPAFAGATQAELEEQQLFADPPRPGAIAPVPEAVDDIVARCLAKSPDQRFESVRALLEALDSPGGTHSGSPIEIWGGVRIDPHLNVIDDSIDDDVADAISQLVELALASGARVVLELDTGILIESPSEEIAARFIASASTLQLSRSQSVRVEIERRSHRPSP